MNKLPKNPYTKLKGRILDDFETIGVAKIWTLLEGCKLGVHKTLALLRQMKQLSSGGTNDDVLCKLLCGALPEMVRTILLTTRVTDWDTVAEAADKVHEDEHVAIYTMISSTADSSPKEASINALLKNVGELISAFNKWTVPDHSRSRSQSRNRRFHNCSHSSHTQSNSKWDMENVTVIINSAILYKSVASGAQNIYHLKKKKDSRNAGNKKQGL